MRNKKGFTLIELLAVIVIIAIVSTIATVGIVSIRSLINSSLLDSKIDIIESGAVYWGQDNMVLLVKSEMPDGNYVADEDSSFGYAAIKTIDDLADYITKNDKCTDSNGEKYSCVQNNVTNENMGSEKIHIYVKNNRVYAKLVTSK